MQRTAASTVQNTIKSSNHSQSRTSCQREERSSPWVKWEMCKVMLAQKLVSEQMLSFFAPAREAHLKLIVTFMNLVLVICSVWVKIKRCTVIKEPLISPRIKSHWEVWIVDYVWLKASLRLYQSFTQWPYSVATVAEENQSSEEECGIKGYIIGDVLERADMNSTYIIATPATQEDGTLKATFPSDAVKSSKHLIPNSKI